MSKPMFRAMMDGSNTKVEADQYTAMLEGALQLMIYRGGNVVQLFELDASSDEYKRCGTLRLEEED